MSTLLEPYDRDVHFPEFKYLPPEIRTQIWALALEYSRIVTFIPGHLFDDRQEYFKSSTPPPALMYVCSESRYITRNAYVNINNDDTTMPVFINPDFDKVYVCCWNPRFDSFDLEDLDLSAVKSLAVMHEDLGLEPISPAAIGVQQSMLNEVVWNMDDDSYYYEKEDFGTWAPGTHKFYLRMSLLLSLANATKLMEVAILVSPPLTSRLDPGKGHIQLIDSYPNANNVQRPGLAGLEENIQAEINWRLLNPGDDLPEEYRDHIVAEGDAFMGRNIHHDYPVQVRAYFATSTPWPSSRYTLEYPCDFLSGVDGLGFNSVWIQKELEDSWFIYNLRLYEPLNAEDKKSTGETPINEQAKDGYKWCIRELKPTPRWEFIHNEIRPALQEPIAVDCILPDAIETSPTLRQELAELFVTTLD